MRTSPSRTTVLAAGAVALALAVTACGSDSKKTVADSGSANTGGSSSSTTLGIGYFSGAGLGPESLVGANPQFADKVPAKFKLTPIDSGVAGLASLRGGAFPAVSAVGNPPVVGAIASGTDIKVVYAESFDAAQLLVNSKIKTNADLVGKKLADLVGSSEDFEIRGWLETQHLTDKVSVVGFPSEAAAGAAFKSGAVDAAYVEIDQALDIKAHGGRTVVTAQQIAELGFPSLNVFAVTSDFAAKHADVVQAFVCQTMNALTALKGKDAATIIGNGAKLVGAGADLAVKAVDATPYVANDEQLKWFKDDGGTIANGRMAKAYVLTAAFLKQQGRVTTIPTVDQIASHIDSSFVEKAIADKCGA